jgi:hypothetical protein
MSGSRTQRRRRISVVSSVLGAAVALAACGSGPDLDPTDPRAATSSSVPAGSSTPTSPGSCDGTIEAEAVDEVVVPRGATCVLIGTRIDGNISVGHLGVLLAREVRVDGDIESEGAQVVKVIDSVVGGNVQLEQGGSATVLGSEVQGDLLFEEQAGTLTAKRNVVRGNVQADGNRGGLSITGNRVGGDLECEENAEVRTIGDNTVSGGRDGQCGRD